MSSRCARTRQQPPLSRWSHLSNLKWFQIEQNGDPLASVTKESSDTLMSMMKQMMERVEKLEQNLSSSRDLNVRQAPPTQEWKCFVLPTEVVCGKCGKEGHYAWGCAMQRPSSQRENKTAVSRAGKGHHQMTQKNIQISPITSIYKQEHTFKDIHRRGRKHINANALTQMPCQQCGRDSHDDPVKEPSQMIRTIQLVGDRSTAELYKLQLNDPVVGIILKAKEMGVDKSVKDNPKSRRLL